VSNSISKFMFQQVGIEKFRKYLDVASVRHKLIAGNVANVSTPGYCSRDIDFDAEVARATQSSDRIIGATTHPDHLPLGNHHAKPPQVSQSSISEGELNSVDIDQEISSMAQNELQFSIAARLLQYKFNGLQKAIKGQ